MKYLILFLLFVSISSYAEKICKEYDETDKTSFSWKEEDFNKKSSTESLLALQGAMNDNGSIGVCHLRNALQLVEGYILKQQAEEALSSVGLAEVVVRFNVSGFCEFLNLSKPCE